MIYLEIILQNLSNSWEKCFISVQLVFYMWKKFRNSRKYKHPYEKDKIRFGFCLNRTFHAFCSRCQFLIPNKIFDWHYLKTIPFFQKGKEMILAWITLQIFSPILLKNR